LTCDKRNCEHPGDHWHGEDDADHLRVHILGLKPDRKERHLDAGPQEQGGIQSCHPRYESPRHSKNRPHCPASARVGYCPIALTCACRRPPGGNILAESTRYLISVNVEDCTCRAR